MGTKKTQVRARDNQGGALDFQHQTTDSPILPSAEYLTQLEQQNPGIIKWFMEETSREAEARRELDNLKVNSFNSAQARGQHYGLFFGILSLVASVALAYFQAYTAATVVGGTSLATVAVALIKGKRSS